VVGDSQFRIDSVASRKNRWATFGNILEQPSAVFRISKTTCCGSPADEMRSLLLDEDGIQFSPADHLLAGCEIGRELSSNGN
jgi:hypothetical protein